MGIARPRRLAGALGGLLVTLALLVAEVALAAGVTGGLYDLGCTHGCHPGDPEFLPVLAGLVAVAGAAHATLSRTGLAVLAAHAWGTAAGLVVVDETLDRLHRASPVDWALAALVASLVWIAGASVARLARRALARPRLAA